VPPRTGAAALGPDDDAGWLGETTVPPRGCIAEAGMTTGTGAAGVLLGWLLGETTVPPRAGAAGVAAGVGDEAGWLVGATTVPPRGAAGVASGASGRAGWDAGPARRAPQPRQNL